MTTKKRLLLASILASTFDAFSTWLFFTITHFGPRGELNLIIRYLYGVFGVFSPFVYLPLEIALVYGLSCFLVKAKYPLLPPAIISTFGIANILSLIILFNQI